MSREQNVPLLLWISTAIIVHIASGGGAEQVARVIEDRSELQFSQFKVELFSLQLFDETLVVSQSEGHRGNVFRCLVG